MGSCSAGCGSSAMPSSPYCGPCLEMKQAVKRIAEWRAERGDHPLPGEEA